MSQLPQAWAVIDRRGGFKRLGILDGPLTELRKRFVLRVSTKSRRVEILGEVVK